MPLPRPLRWYAATSLALVATYLAWPQDWRIVPFLLVTVGAVPAVLAATLRTPRDAPLLWRTLLVALVCFNAGNLVWIYHVYVAGRVTGDGTAADGLFALAGVLLLVAAVAVVVRRGRRDVGGIIDAAVVALGFGGVLWSTVLLPQLAEAGAPMTRQLALFVHVYVLLATLGAMARVALVAGRTVIALHLFVVALAFAVGGHLAVTFATDPVTGVRPDWTNMLFMASYAALGCAALHPSARLITQPGPAPVDDLSTGRLVFLGATIALIPLIGGGRVVFGLPTDGVLIALGSAAVIPLVMIRIARLSGQRRRAEQALVRAATHDALTGLPNRAACLDRLTADLAVPGPGQPAGLAVLFCDLDGFKPVNDRLGHAAGDTLLTAVAGRLRACTRSVDLVARFGGDEFVIVLHDADPVTAAAVLCDRIRDVVLRPYAVDGEQVCVGLSVGVAYAGPDTTADEVIGRADLAMYAAKQSKAIGALSLATA
ncbi:GGDEF domain-containing protein [Spirilliplanes yamanashiensis]|nr:GGDEF domain-containing protein [Spirilliplanes yamanashiensis]MDP9817462.1 diguanylate cyclase (GGDEF)-like protein [Spirilliplanes yamanashiensis]